MENLVPNLSGPGTLNSDSEHRVEVEAHTDTPQEQELVNSTRDRIQQEPNSTNLTVTVTQPQSGPGPNATDEGNDEGGEDETEESLLVVEQALASCGLKDASGFKLKFGSMGMMPCCPKFSMRPFIGFHPFSITANGWEAVASSNAGCYCCFAPISRSWQTITLTRGDVEVINFMYRPQVWCLGGKKERIVDIYIPQRNKRIGWIKYKDNFENGALIVDCLSKSVLVAKKVNTNDAVVAMNIYTNFGDPVAIAQSTRGWRQRGFVTWTEFEMNYSPLAISTASSIKGVMMVAFAMWVLSHRERTVRWRCTFMLAMITLGIVIGVVLGLSGSSTTNN